ncbi:energy-coupling factor transporter ATPase [Oceanirhabdus sp. W0125-5]|uniref:energy-coupling factor transporter ATPase n=1 Tax=Oceanirhabdus sp. W0125-5 TaxID=2999116 RepID=UPI0022F2BBE3|nr:energy-coupling factor transporter ATPase [Oceanirhabdus sp. W0125-5]WBW98023.1 energy-coupling factor transporter ATPase [Oceanirhabdus sp. W0125-5]
MGKTYIECSNVKFSYIFDEEKVEVLHGINLNINQGEFVAILGHNGSGKSTLAKHLNALLVPHEGIVSINNIDTSDSKKHWEVRKNVGMVFQNPDNQIVATIVEEDVAFGPENIGIEPQEIRKRVDDALDTVNMSEYKKHAPHMLSGGQKQRVAIAGVIAMRSDCIVLDEPTAMLDPIGRKEVINTITKLNKEYGITVILITHFMEEAIKADRVIVMDSGDVIMDDKPRSIFTEVKKLKEIGLDVPSVTELAYRLKEMGMPIRNDIISIDEMVSELCQLL